MADVTVDQFLAVARRAIGTVWVDEGRLIGVALDCIGLPLVCGQEVGLVPRELRIEGYGRTPRPGEFELERGLALYLERGVLPENTDDLRLGAVLALSWSDPSKIGDAREAHHLAILGNHPKFPRERTLIHASREVKKPRNNFKGEVVEQTLDARWASRIVSVWHFRGLA